MEKLYLGIAREIITPEVGGRLYGYRPDIYSERVNDDLTATAYYFQQGQTKALMVSITLCSIGKTVADRLLKEIEDRFGITCAMLSAIHTHSGPCMQGRDGWGDADTEYIENIFIPGLLKAVERAVANPVPVKMGIACGNSFVGINRRELTLENKTKLGQNPWGPFNPRMTVISFRDEAGNAVANMIHYGAHCTAAGHNHEVSRDWPGPMIDRLETETGGITAFFNGPEGDVGPRLSNGKTIGDLSHVYELGAVAAQDAVRIYRSITGWHTPVLRAGSGICRIPLKARLTEEEARKMYEENKDSTVNLRAAMRRSALETLQQYETGIPEEQEYTFRQPMVALDENVLTGFPYELFSELGLRMDAAFPDARILPIVNTNGALAYFVTQDAICRGGYEVNHFLYSRVQAYCEHSDWHLVTEAVNNIKTVLTEE